MERKGSEKSYCGLLAFSGSSSHKRGMTNDWRDRLGVCLSVLCMAHCLLTPLVLAIVPLGSAFGFWHTGFHQVFLFIVPLIAAVAFVPGWRLHRDSRVWVYAVIGFVFLFAGSQVGSIFGANLATHLDHSATALHTAQHTSGNHEFQWAPLLAELLFTILGGFFFIRAHLLNRKLCACCSRDHAHEPQVVV